MFFRRGAPERQGQAIQRGQWRWLSSSTKRRKCPRPRKLLRSMILVARQKAKQEKEKNLWNQALRHEDDGKYHKEACWYWRSVEDTGNFKGRDFKNKVKARGIICFQWTTGTQAAGRLHRTIDGNRWGKQLLDWLLSLCTVLSLLHNWRQVRPGRSFSACVFRCRKLINVCAPIIRVHAIFAPYNVDARNDRWFEWARLVQRWKWRLEKVAEALR